MATPLADIGQPDASQSNQQRQGLKLGTRNERPFGKTAPAASQQAAASCAKPRRRNLGQCRKTTTGNGSDLEASSANNRANCRGPSGAQKQPVGAASPLNGNFAANDSNFIDLEQQLVGSSNRHRHHHQHQQQQLAPSKVPVVTQTLAVSSNFALCPKTAASGRKSSPGAGSPGGKSLAARKAARQVGAAPARPRSQLQAPKSAPEGPVALLCGGLDAKNGLVRQAALYARRQAALTYKPAAHLLATATGAGCKTRQPALALPGGSNIAAIAANLSAQAATAAITSRQGRPGKLQSSSSASLSSNKQIIITRSSHARRQAIAAPAVAIESAGRSRKLSSQSSIQSASLLSSSSSSLSLQIPISVKRPKQVACCQHLDTSGQVFAAPAATAARGQFRVSSSWKFAARRGFSCTRSGDSAALAKAICVGAPPTAVARATGAARASSTGSASVATSRGSSNSLANADSGASLASACSLLAFRASRTSRSNSSSGSSSSSSGFDQQQQQQQRNGNKRKQSNNFNRKPALLATTPIATSETNQPDIGTDIVAANRLIGVATASAATAPAASRDSRAGAANLFANNSQQQLLQSPTQATRMISQDKTGSSCCNAGDMNSTDTCDRHRRNHIAIVCAKGLAMAGQGHQQTIVGATDSTPPDQSTVLADKPSANIINNNNNNTINTTTTTTSHPLKHQNPLGPSQATNIAPDALAKSCCQTIDQNAPAIQQVDKISHLAAHQLTDKSWQPAEPSIDTSRLVHVVGNENHQLQDEEHMVLGSPVLTPQPTSYSDDEENDKSLIDDTKPDLQVRFDSISDRYDMEARPFARGKFAQVKRCVQRQTNQCYAAKCIKKRRRLADIKHEILLEIEALKLSYSCDHIVRIYDVYDTPTEMILVLEMAEGGELQRVLDDEEKFDELLVKKMIGQILEGLVCLHDHDIAHLDLKPQNILLKSLFPQVDVKLCDFGLSRRISKDSEVREICGTPDYVAPEILRYEPISLNTDMWSLGILTYVLLSGYSPFGGNSRQETFCNITQANLDFPGEIFDQVSDDGIDFMQKIIVKEPGARLTSRKARNHPWLRG